MLRPGSVGVRFEERSCAEATTLTKRYKSMSEQELASYKWWEHYWEAVNSDEEMQVGGNDEFSESFYVEIGEERFIIEMNNRTVNDITPNPGLNQDWSFGVEDEDLPGAIRPEDIGVDLY